MFDTLEFADDLQKAGFTREQAEIQVRGLSRMMTTNFATKADVKDLLIEMRELETRLTIRMGAIGMATVTLVVTLLKVL